MEVVGLLEEGTLLVNDDGVESFMLNELGSSSLKVVSNGSPEGFAIMA